MRCKNVGTTLFRSRLTDRQTSGRTEWMESRTAFSWLDRVACSACSAVKTLRGQPD